MSLPKFTGYSRAHRVVSRRIGHAAMPMFCMCKRCSRSYLINRDTHLCVQPSANHAHTHVSRYGSHWLSSLNPSFPGFLVVSAAGLDTPPSLDQLAALAGVPIPAAMSQTPSNARVDSFSASALAASPTVQEEFLALVGAAQQQPESPSLDGHDGSGSAMDVDSASHRSESPPPESFVGVLPGEGDGGTVRPRLHTAASACASLRTCQKQRRSGSCASCG